MSELEQIVADIDRFDRQCREAEYTDTVEAWDLLNAVRDLASRAPAPAEVVVLWAPGEEPGVWIARRGAQATLLPLEAGAHVAGVEALLVALFDALGVAVEVRSVEVAPAELAGEGWDWEAVARTWLSHTYPDCFARRNPQ